MTDHSDHTDLTATDGLRSTTSDQLPHPGQSVRVVRGGDVMSATVAWTDGRLVHVVAEADPGPQLTAIGNAVRLIWRGETQAICVDGVSSPGHSEWTIVCDPTSVSTLEERARRRVAVRAPADLTVPTRFVPQVQTTWTINLSESGVALEPQRGLRVAVGEPLVLRLGLDITPVLTVGRVVDAQPAQPVRVAFDRMSPTVRGQLIGVVNRLEAAARVHTR